MDTLNDMMTDLLIDYDDRLQEQRVTKSLDFTIKAQKAEKVIIKGKDIYANQN